MSAGRGMVRLSLPGIEKLEGGDFSLSIGNCDRSIGARVSGEIARRHGNQGMVKAPLTFRFKGTAGQSFGVWNAGGLHMYLEGDANDYVGKGMTGGKLVITPPQGAGFKSQESAIIGNTCLYGAPVAKLFAAGTPVSASGCATPGPTRWWKAPATTAAST